MVMRKKRKIQDIEEFFERKLITGLITKTEFIEQALPMLDISLIEPEELRLIASWCAGYYQEYRRAPGQEIESLFMEQLKAERINKAEAQYIEEVLSSLSDEYEQEDSLDTNYLLDQTKKYIRTRKLTIIGEDVLRLVRRGEVLQAEGLIRSFDYVIGDPEQHKSVVKTGTELLDMEIPEPVWAVPGLIPAGATLLAGKSKIGKSFLILNMAVEMVRGGMVLGRIKSEPTGVLYLALEDPDWRVQKRLNDMEVDREEIEQLYIATTWPRGPEGIAKLDTFLKEKPNVKVVFVDVLEKFRSQGRGDDDNYRAAYQAVSLIKELADKHGITIIVAHHTRKAKSTDYLDTVLGSTGLVGAADTALVMERKRGNNNAVLFITGRDVEDQCLALSRSYKHGWRLLDDSVKVEEFEQTPERQELIQILRERGKPVQLKDLSMAVGKSESNVRGLLKKLIDEEIVCQPEYGKYATSITKELEDKDKRRCIPKGAVLRNIEKQLAEKQQNENHLVQIV